MLISAVLVPFGLLIYGWSSQYRINTVVPNISLIIIFMGLLPGFNCPAAYITDTYGKEYTASASASGAFLRTICGFSFPLFGPNFFASVGMGRGCTVLAALTLLMGIGPLAIYRWGPWLRAHSTQGMPGAKEKRDSEKVKDEEVLVEGKEMTPLSTIVPTPDKTRDAAPDNDSTGLAEEEAEVEGKTRNEDGRAILTRVAENSTDAITPLGQAQVETTQGVSRVVERAPSPAAAESSSSSSEKSNSVDSARWQTHSNGPETTPAVHPPMNASSAGDSKPDDQFVRDNDGRMLDYSLGTPSERRTRWPPKCRGIPSVACGDDGRAKEDEMPNEFQEVRSDVAVVGTRRPRFGEVRLVRMRPGSSALRRVDTGGEHVPRQSQASSIHTFELQP